MKLSRAKKLIEYTFTDLVSIKRYADSANDDSTTDTILPANYLYSDVPCRLSYIRMESPSGKEVDAVPVETAPKLFFKVEQDAIAGDFVLVKKIDDGGNVIAQYTGQIGLPAVYVTHKEALFSIKGQA